MSGLQGQGKWVGGVLAGADGLQSPCQVTTAAGYTLGTPGPRAAPLGDTGQRESHPSRP